MFDSLRFCLLGFGFLIVSMSIQAQQADFKQPEPLEPEIAAASDEGAEAMSAIRIPEGWEIALFAAEPDIANVVAFDIDHRGRIFACETFRQNRGVTDNRAHDEAWQLADLASETVQDRIDYHKRLLGEAAITYAQHDDRIRRLEDSDGDGKVDRSYVVANGFNRLEDGTGAGVLVRGNEIFYACIPKLWKLSDSDDDGNADQRKVLADGFGVRVAFRGHDMHGFVMGPDGRLYFSVGDRGYHVTTEDGRLLADPSSGAVFRCELDGSNLEVFATGLRNPQELAFNDVGDLFSVDNNSDSGDRARIVHLLEGGDSGWRMYYQYLPDRGPFNRERIWEPIHAGQPAYIVPPIANFSDGPSGFAHYPGTGFGDALKDTFFICDFRGGPANSGIRTFKLSPSGAFYQLETDSDPIWTVLATDLAFGPDGALYVSDWVDGWDGLGKGRIYRLTDPEHSETPVVKEVQQLLASQWSGQTTEQLISHLGHIDRRVRLESQWELARRADVETLTGVLNDAEAGKWKRLHAIWGIDQIARVEPERRELLLAAIRPLLNDEDATLRAAAAKMAGERLDVTSTETLQGLMSDTSDRVRYFACLSLAKLRAQPALATVIRMIAENKDRDPAIRHAGVVYLASLNQPEKMAGLSRHPNESVRLAAAVALRRLRSGELAKFLNDDSDAVVAEAARAIHDLPIPVAMQSLASLIDGELAKGDLNRRILNANFRLGTEDAAKALGDYASRTSAPAEMRVEALRMLADWAQPDPRDRVVNDYRPLNPRDGKQAAVALERHIESLMTAEDLVRDAAIEVAAGLGIRKIAPMLVERVRDSQVQPEQRATALESLARLQPAVAVNLAKQVKMLPPTELVPAALRVLATHDAKNSLPKFVQAIQSRNVKIRQLGWDILAKDETTEGRQVIADAVESWLRNELTPDVHLNVFEASKDKLDDDLQSKLDAHLSATAKSEPLGPWLMALEGGDVEAGRRLFFENSKLSCVRCHKVDRAGGEVGPNLTLIGSQKDRRYLLESICLPSAQIAKGFETAVIANDSGQVFTGIVKSETDEYVELIQNDGSQVRILQDEVSARRKGQSSMPSDLIQFMSTRELRDLVSYLASLQADSRGAGETE
ncbi:MAG: c-type cytochrome [Planctomycetaceae bacterium]|nr:c-type cytochrome [Planctomycetaceae bacterium]